MQMVTGKMGSAGIRLVLGLLLHQGFLQLSVYGNIKLETEYDPGYRFVAGGDGECTFKVRAASDVDIEFSADQAQTKQVLEIVLGGANNMRSQIRSKAGELVEKQTPAILSAKEYRSFWIRWNDHAVTVGKQGSNEPIMTYQVDKISPMKVISIGVDGSATSGSWVIDKPATQSPVTTQKPKANEKPKATQKPTTTKKPATAAPTRKTPPPVTTPKPPAKWVSTYGNHVPSNAIPGGNYEHLRPQYIGRAWYKDNLIPGAVDQLAGVCYVAWHSVSHFVNNYEVLVDTKGKFVQTSGGNIPPNALKAGYTGKKEDLYICRASHKGFKLLGKAQTTHHACYVGYRGKEYAYKEYEIYVY